MRQMQYAGAAAAAVLMLVWLLGSLTATAAPMSTITVTTTEDELNNDGDCALREAVEAANTDTAVDACQAGSGSDTILIPAGTYLLTRANTTSGEDLNQTGDLDIRATVSLVGAGADTTVIDANGLDRVLHIPLARVDTAVSGITIRGGNLGTGTGPSYSGGGIALISGSTLTLTQVTITDNEASFNAELLLSGSGGGIYNNGGSLVLDEVTISHNRGGVTGGLYNSGQLSMTRSTILGNESSFYGGGMAHVGNSAITITHSTIGQNIAGTNGGGLMVNSGSVTLENVSISENTARNFSGGGLWVYYEGVLAVNLSHSTLWQNTAGTGGGFMITHQQGRIAPPAAEAPTAVTAVQFQMINTLIADNTGGDCVRSAQTEPVLSLGYNLDSDNSCELQQTTDLPNTTLTLGPLQDNGGPTPTNAVPPGSPVIDTGGCLNVWNTAVATDQRGISRPQSTSCDIGAYEFVAGSHADLTLTKEAALPTVTVGQPLTYTLTVSNLGPDAAANVVVTDVLPVGATFTGSSGSGWTCLDNGGTVTCSQATPMVNLMTSNLTLYATAPMASGTIINTAVVTTAALDVDKSQNSDTAVVQVVDPALPEADLQLTAVAAPSPVTAGTSLVYTLTVTNIGPDTAVPITLTNVLPAAVDLLTTTAPGWNCQYLSQTSTCTLPALAATEVSTVTLHTLAPATAGVITNTTTLTSTTSDPQPINNTQILTTTVAPLPVEQADLSISQAISPTTIVGGDWVTSTLTVHNAGTHTAVQVTANDTLPPGVTDVTAGGSNWLCNVQTDAITCTCAQIAVGQDETIVVQFRTPALTSPLQNLVSVQAQTADPNPHNNLHTAILVVQAPYQLFLPTIVR